MRLRAVLLVLAGLAVAGIGVVAAVLLTTDFNRYRGLIADQVKQATGRELAIGGDLQLALSLSPTVAVNDVALANAAWGSRPQMATVQRLEMELALLPLLSGEIRVKRLVLVGADILLESDREGRANWAFGEPAPEAAAPVSGGLRPPTVNDVLVEDSTIVYRDAASDTIRTVKLARLAAHADDLASPIGLELEGAVNGAPVRLQGTFGALQLILDGKPFPIELEGESNGAKVGAIGRIGQPLRGGVDLAVTAEGANLADLSLLAGMPLPKLGPYDLAADLSNPQGNVQITRLRARLGTSDVAGEIVMSARDGRPRIEARLASERIDLRDFGIAAEPNGGAGAGDGRVFPAEPLALAGLKDLDAAIEITARQLVKRPVIMSGVSAALGLEQGKLTIQRFESGLAGGTLTLTGTVDASMKPAAIVAKAKARGVEAGALLQTMAINDVLSGGKANLDLDLRGRGDSVRAIMAGLDGTSNLEMGPGQINNAFARLFFADLFNLISFGSEGERSNLNCVVTRFDIRKGLAASRGLVIDTGGGTIIGAGTVNLADERLDLAFEPNAKLASLANFAVPVQVKGTIGSPSVAPDPAGVATLVAKGVAIGATGGIFAALAGLAGVNALENAAAGNPCVAALGAGTESAPSKPVGDRILEGTGDALQGVGKSLQGVGDTLKGLFD